MSTIKDFYLGARPKTLSAALSPILIGGALSFAIFEEKNIDFNSSSVSTLFACFIVSIFLQIGVNYANDYSDGKKGTDNNRVGPMRLVSSGRASSSSVFIAMCVSFFIACLGGIYVSSQSSWWMLLVGALCVALAYLYTGTKFAYGYYGFGELVVFICFGLVATVGTYYAITNDITLLSIVGSVIPGMFSVSILLANNIRDIDTDRASNKKTLSARIGHTTSSLLFGIANLLIWLSILFIGLTYSYVLFALFVLPALGYLNKNIVNAKSPKDFINVLVLSSKVNIITSTLVSVLIIYSVIKG
jgi:1,4-dihydroxy-2-naphthoate octaprenyltransferase